MSSPHLRQKPLELVQLLALLLISAILREITTKGKDPRFRKAERGKFVLNG